MRSGGGKGSRSRGQVAPSGRLTRTCNLRPRFLPAPLLRVRWRGAGGYWAVKRWRGLWLGGEGAFVEGGAKWAASAEASCDGGTFGAAGKEGRGRQREAKAPSEACAECCRARKRRRRWRPAPAPAPAPLCSMRASALPQQPGPGGPRDTPSGPGSPRTPQAASPSPPPSEPCPLQLCPLQPPAPAAARRTRARTNEHTKRHSPAPAGEARRGRFDHRRARINLPSAAVQFFFFAKAWISGNRPPDPLHLARSAARRGAPGGGGQLFM